MCEFIIVSGPTSTGKEYYANIRVGDFYSIISFDCLLEEKEIKITYPDDSELSSHLTFDCIKKLKETLWKKTRVREITNNISQENRSGRNKDYIDLLDKMEE